MSKTGQYLALPLLLFLSASSGNSGTESQRQDFVSTFAPGPDVIVGELSPLTQFGSSGTQVGLAMGTDSCNNGDVEVNFFAMPNPDHPVIAQNLYRMSGGVAGNERFEQIGQSWLKQEYFALQSNLCGFGCSSASDGTHLGVGCSNPDSATINAAQTDLGSRAWINPYTGVFPANANSHTGHTHTGSSHRILVEGSDLNTTMNPGATYYAEAQFVTPHEYAWCQAHSGECNLDNNTSYRRFSVSGTTSFAFSAVGPTVRMTPAISGWSGATITTIEPAPGIDGRAFVGYKVSNPSAGVWHYEYAIYNQNLDRALQSFSVPLGCGLTVSNLGFHAPPNHPGFPNDGTLGNLGYSNAAWTTNQSASALSWSSETILLNENANALRWGTLYNFRFDSDRPPQAVNATIGFFKTGNPVTAEIQGPTPDPCNLLQLVSAVSRKTHGAAGDFDIDLPLAGEPGVESRDGGGNHTIVVTFSNPMASGNASVTKGAGAIAGSPTFSGNTMTVKVTGVADVQKLTVTLQNVTDSLGQILPDTSLSMKLLIGDTDSNKTVNTTDIGRTKAQSGLPATAPNFRTDINASGAITASDVGEVKANAGHTVP